MLSNRRYMTLFNMDACSHAHVYHVLFVVRQDFSSALDWVGFVGESGVKSRSNHMVNSGFFRFRMQGLSPRLQRKSFPLLQQCSAFAHWQERRLWPLLLKNLRAKL